MTTEFKERAGRLPSPEILADRFRSATTGARRVLELDGRAGMALDNHRDFYRWERIVERIACEVYGDQLTPDQVEQVAEIAASAWEGLEESLTKWAQAPAAR